MPLLSSSGSAVSTTNHLPDKSPGKRFMEFLGSMELAITLLSALAIASVIGTILQQNQSYQDYLLKFGPFWFEVFEKMALYDVYSAVWFLLILAFLILSTSVCVYRHAPIMLREIRAFRLNAQLKSLQSFHHQQQWQTTDKAVDVGAMGVAFFTRLGYQARRQSHDDHQLIAAKRGGANRWGYLLTHVGVIVICLGALLDSKINFMVLEWMGELAPETRNIPASEVPSVSRINTSNASFRGTVQIPEGDMANMVFLNMRDGYLVQELPFAIELKDFRVEHYSTGQPKSFESDLIIHDDQLDQPLEATIAVNHPLIYRGFALYQASFGDGGSEMDLRLWSLRDDPGASVNIEAEVFETRQLSSGGEQLSLELNDFRLFNINPVLDEQGKTVQQNFGPSVTFKVRNPDGVAREYINYMNPVTIEGKTSFISGMRDDPTQPFRYLHLPVDPDGGVERFMGFLKSINDESLVAEAAEDTVNASMGRANIDDDQLSRDISRSMQNLVSLFKRGGYEAVINDVMSRVPAEKQAEVTDAYLKILQGVLSHVYGRFLEQQGIAEPSDDDWLYFDEAVESLNTLPYYGSPVYVQMTQFNHIQAAGIQITRSPGKNIVYFGCVLLMIGVFLLFYINPIRYWLWIDEQAGNTRVVLAGVSHRQTIDFDRQFDETCQKLAQQLNKVN